MVTDTIKATIKNNIKLINTTSLSHSQNYVVKWQHISTISFPTTSTILYFLTNFKRTKQEVQADEILGL